MGPCASAKPLRNPRCGLMMVERPDDPTRLNGCGLFVINPPWTLRDEAETILPALANRLARRGYGTYRCDWLREPPNG